MVTAVGAGVGVPLPPGVFVLSLRVQGRAATRSGARLGLDASAFVVDRTGRALGDEWFVFYGASESPGAAVAWREDAPGDSVVTVDLRRLPEHADGVVLTASLYQAAGAGTSLADLQGGFVDVVDHLGGSFRVRYPVPPGPADADAAVLAAVFRRPGGRAGDGPGGNGSAPGWSVRTAAWPVGTGLAGLADLFGVQVG